MIPKLRVFLLAIALCFAVCATMAQKKELTLEEIFTNRSLYVKYLINLQPVGNSDDFSWIGDNFLIKLTSSSNATDTILRLYSLNNALSEAGSSKIKRFPSIDWIDTQMFWFRNADEFWKYDLKSGDAVKIATLPEDATGIDLNKKTGSIAFTIGNNLYVNIAGSEKALSGDPDTNIIYGQIVHRNEWGIDKGTFWSPDGSRLAYYRMDQTMVTGYPVVNTDARIAEVQYTKYPMAGMTSHEVTVEVFEVATGRVITLKTPPPKDHFLTNITWSHDGNSIFIAELNREQNHMMLKQYNAQTGDFIKTLFEEEDDKYVEPLHGLYFVPDNSGRFVWISRRDGWNHLYLYNSSGTLISQLTSGKWEVAEFLGFSGDGKTASFTANRESPICRNIYQINLKSKDIHCIATDKGSHGAVMSHSGKYFLDEFSSAKISMRYCLMDNSGKTIRTILEGENTLVDYKIGEMLLFSLKNTDGTDLWCRMIKPPDFNETKKYPVIIYVYGGPHSQMVTESWLGGAGLFLNYLATQGYVVFTLDNRGTNMRGKEFEQAIFRHLGRIETDDQMVGVEYLKSLPYVDPARIGVHGWSYGGFLSISLATMYPESFKTAVAGGPVIDWKWYEVMYGERYMDTPQENPEGYKEASLLEKADKLKAKLLIIHGTMDATVVWQNSLSFIQRCVQEEILLDYFVYPGHEHNVSGMDRKHLYRKIDEYFKENL